MTPSPNSRQSNFFCFGDGGSDGGGGDDDDDDDDELISIWFTRSKFKFT